MSQRDFDQNDEVDFAPLERLGRDLRASAALLQPREVRYVVDLYYQSQEYRKRAANQKRAAEEDAEPNQLVQWALAQFHGIEGQIRRAMQAYSESQRPGRWALSVYGIGPVISAGLLAHIDIEKAPTAGHIWRFAGLDPTLRWGKGEVRPWNARLKTLCWKIGDSFVKQSGKDQCIYGKLYRERKAIEVARNEAGAFAQLAADKLRDFKIQDPETKATYEAGRLPAGRLDLRARRYAVKLFLSHLQHVLYEDRFQEKPAKPYIFTREEHAHYLSPPGWPCE